MWRWLLIALAVAAIGCDCENEVSSLIASPDSTFTAVVFQRSCGATVGDNVQVSVVRAGERQSGPGNVFVADDSAGTGNPTSGVSVQWDTAGGLLITYDPALRIIERATKRDGVGIRYVSRQR